MPQNTKVFRSMERSIALKCDVFNKNY